MSSASLDGDFFEIPEAEAEKAESQKKRPAKEVSEAWYGRLIEGPKTQVARA